MRPTLKALAAVLASSLVATGIAYAASSPTVATGTASSITTSTVVLHARVNPNGVPTYYRFEAGLTTQFGLSSAVKLAGRGTTTVPVSVKLGGLLPGTVYYYRVDALSKSGASTGISLSFKTVGNPPPDAATGPTLVVSSSAAAVTGVINPHHQATTYFFQYGQYGQPTTGDSQTAPKSVLTGSVPVNVSSVIFGLTPGTLFHYRIVALHSDAPPIPGTYGTFMTFPSPRSVPRVLAHTTPRRAGHRPYVFATSGRIAGRPTVPASLGCSQGATVRFLLGRRQVASDLVTVMPDCRFTAVTAFNHLPGRGRAHKRRRVVLKVLIHFRGNSYLAPADARPERVTLG